MSDELKRLSREEQSGVFDLLTALDCCADALRKLSIRTGRIPDAKERIEKTFDLLSKATTDVLVSAPYEQLKHIQNQRKGLKHRIWVGNTAIPPRDKDEGRFFDINEQNLIVKAIREYCAVCPYDKPHEQQSCAYRKLLDKLNADPDEAGENCGWFTFLGRI